MSRLGKSAFFYHPYLLLSYVHLLYHVYDDPTEKVSFSLIHEVPDLVLTCSLVSMNGVLSICSPTE